MRGEGAAGQEYISPVAAWFASRRGWASPCTGMSSLLRDWLFLWSGVAILVTDATPSQAEHRPVSGWDGWQGGLWQNTADGGAVGDTKCLPASRPLSSPSLTPTTLRRRRQP